MAFMINLSGRCNPSLPKLTTWPSSSTPRIMGVMSHPQVQQIQVRNSNPIASMVGVSRDTAQPSSSFVSTVGNPSPIPPTSLVTWNLTHRHLLLLNVIACAVAVSASCLFFAAIPTLIAFKKAAESLANLLDVTREELPGTMAAVRLSGMEISDLTMELSDLGQEITEGVRRSTRAVRAAEDGLRHMTSMASVASLQDRAKVQANILKPAIARTARSLHDGIVQGRSTLKSLIALNQLSGWLSRYWCKKRKHVRHIKDSDY